MWNERQIAVQETNYKANNILHVLYFYIFYIFLWLPLVVELNVGYIYIPNIKSISHRTSKKKFGKLKVWTKNTSSRAITQPNIIRPERNSNLNCNSSRYSHIPNIKSISQRTSIKSPDNLKFEQKKQVQGP
jgi:hypothetical protein